jgi:hypothetical protein
MEYVEHMPLAGLAWQVHAQQQHLPLRPALPVGANE